MVGTRETDGFEQNHCSVVNVEHFIFVQNRRLRSCLRDLKHTIATIMTQNYNFDINM